MTSLAKPNICQHCNINPCKDIYCGSCVMELKYGKIRCNSCKKYKTKSKFPDANYDICVVCIDKNEEKLFVDYTVEGINYVGGESSFTLVSTYKPNFKTALKMAPYLQKITKVYRTYS